MNMNTNLVKGNEPRKVALTRARIKSRRKRQVAKAIAGAVVGGIVAGPVGIVAGAAAGATVRRGPVRDRHATPPQAPPKMGKP